MAKKIRILIIDDSVETVDGLTCFLCDRYEVIKAYTGSQGLSLYNNGVDLVITDLMLPDISGIRLLSTFKSIKPNIPIVAMTGWDDFSILSIAAAGEKKADKILKKPFELDDLEKSMTELLNHNTFR